MRCTPTRRSVIHAPALRRSCSILAATLLAGAALAGTITVNTTTDELDLVPNGTCSLREAVVTVNEQRALGIGGCSVVGTLGVDDTIVVPAGDYRLTRVSPHYLLPNQDHGSLEIRRSVRIVGAGASSTLIDGTGRDRVLEILGGTVRIERLTIHNGKFESRHWEGTGAGVRIPNGSTHVVLEDVVVRDNVANKAAGIENVFGTLTLRRTTVRDNVATSAHGGGIFSRGRLTLIDSTVSGNRAEAAHGGGIFALGNSTFPTSARLIGSTVSGNWAATGGGGIWNERQHLILDNVTVSDNSSGVHQVAGDAGHSIDIFNTIIAGNDADADCTGPLRSHGYNLIGNASTCTVASASQRDQLGTSASVIDARLGPLAFNGGVTSTHALLPGSPAIDRGAFPFDGGCGNLDQRGSVRPADGTGDGIVRCDVGAFEADTVPYTADLRVSITQTPNEVFPNAPVATTIEIVNHGPARALNARYQITVPVDAPLPPLPAGCEHTATRTYGCPLGNIAQGVTRTIDNVIQAPSRLGAAQTTVTVSSDVPDPLGGNTASATTIVIAPPDDIHVTVLASEDPVGTLSLFTYRVVVQNRSSTTTATSVSARHEFSPGLTAIGCFPYPCDLLADGGALVGPIPSIAPGDSVTHNVNVIAPDAAGTISNTVTLTSAPFAAATTTVTGTVLPPAADLAPVLSASHDAVEPGQAFTYTVFGRNLGTSRTNASFTLTLPEGASVTGTTWASDCAQPDDLVIVCAFYDQLWPGHGAIAHVDVLAPSEEGIATATVTVVGPLPDPDPTNDTDTLTVIVGDQVAQALSADVALAISAPPFVLPGEPITYGLLVTNLGPGTATGIDVWDGAPEGLSIVSRSSACAAPDGTPVCRLAELAYGASHLFEVTVVAPDALGPITAAASVTTSSVDPRADNDEAAAITEVVDALPLEETTILVESGPEALADVTITTGSGDVAALQARFVSEAPNLGLTGLRLTREASAGAPGGTLRIYLDDDANAAVGPDDVLLTTATFTASDTVLLVDLDPGVEVRHDGSTVILVTLEADAVSGRTGAPFVMAAGLLALLGLRRPKRRLLALSLMAAITLASCAQTPPAVEAATIRLHLTDAAFSADGARAVGMPVAGRSIIVRP